MSADRRTILAVIGAGAVTVGSFGYLNRRRFRRRDDLAAIDEALDVSVPSVDGGPLVTDDHLETAFERSSDAIAEARDRLGEEYPFDPDLEELAPSSLEGASRDERSRALNDLSSHAVEARMALAHYRYERERHDWSALEDRIADEREAVEDVTVDYRASSLSEAIAQYARVDSRLDGAASDLEGAADRLGDGEAGYALGWRWSERAAFRRLDAEGFARAVDGDDYEARLREILEQTVDAVEREREAVDVDHPDAEHNYAMDVMTSNAVFAEGRETTSIPRSLSRSYPQENERGSMPSRRPSRRTVTTRLAAGCWPTLSISSRPPTANSSRPATA